jgi:hypothetical protein
LFHTCVAETRSFEQYAKMVLAAAMPSEVGRTLDRLADAVAG